MKIALVAVVSGSKYERYAEEMFETADRYFFSNERIERLFLRFEARIGWPDATLYRYHSLLDQSVRFKGVSHIYMIDADMRFVAPVGSEILGGLVATQHPGFVGRRGTYEGRTESSAYVRADEGTIYFCGGFVGGEASTFLRLAHSIKEAIDRDDRLGITAQWHDESHLNRQLIDTPPEVVLSPSYCYPETARAKRSWTQEYEPRIVAVTKKHELSRVWEIVRGKMAFRSS